MDFCIREKDDWFEIPSGIVNVLLRNNFGEVWEAVGAGDVDEAGSALSVSVMLFNYGENVEFFDRKDHDEDDEGDEEYEGPVRLKIIQQPSNDLDSTSSVRMWIQLPLDPADW